MLLFNFQIGLGQVPSNIDKKIIISTPYDYRVEELKVRWKKAAVENCTPCPVVTPSVCNNTVTSTTGKIWMCSNLGATQVATSSTDAASYGDLYQWGRGSDGHQLRTSGTTLITSMSDSPGNSNFINFNSPSTPPSDWRSPQNDNLWQQVGSANINNPCPTGFRVPTETELNAERLIFSSQDAAGAFASVLKLPMAGYRNLSGNLNIEGSYWSSTVTSTPSGLFSRYLDFDTNTNSASMTSSARGYGRSVRCIKNSVN